MQINKRPQAALYTLTLAVALAQSPPAAHDSLSRRILRMGDSELATFAKSYLDAGMPGEAERTTAFDILILNRSSLVLPMIERKIEEVIKSSNPTECFTEKAVDPQRFIGYAASALSRGGDEQAIIEVGKLLELDMKRFDRIVNAVMAAVHTNENPFALAYRSFEIGSSAVHNRVAAWAEDTIIHEPPDNSPVGMRQQWATAMADHYGAVPDQKQWDTDPIVSRMKPGVAKMLRSDMDRLTREAWERRMLPTRMLGMTEGEQTAFTKAQLDIGIPDDQVDALKALARGRSSLVLPLIASKMEQVLRSPNPLELFIDKIVEPRVFLYHAAEIIAEAGDDEALRQAARLLKLKRYAGLPITILNVAEQRGNPFPLVYRGLEMGDADLASVIAKWAEQALAEPAENLPKDRRHRWAEALVARYGGAPIAAQWARDPIASRLNHTFAESVRSEVLRLADEASSRRAPK